jgi:hypothetical protein
MTTRAEAADYVALYLKAPAEIRDLDTLMRVADSYVYMRYPIPQSLGEQIAAILQLAEPPGWRVLVHAYQGGLRVMRIKQKAQERFFGRPPEEHD